MPIRSSPGSHENTGLNAPTESVTADRFK